METSIHQQPLWLLIVRWTARLTALSFLFFALTFLVGSYMDPSSRPGPQNLTDYFFLSLMGFTLLGYLVGLWSEGIGGFIGLSVSIIFLIWLSLVITLDFHVFLAFLFSILPSTLYLISWFFHRKLRQDQFKRSEVSSKI